MKMKFDLLTSIREISITKSVQSIIAKIRQFGRLKNFQAWKTCRQDTVFFTGFRGEALNQFKRQ